jgi:alkanesulfonate monooxygenase
MSACDLRGSHTLLSLAQPDNLTPVRLKTGPFGETIGNEYHRPQKQASQS